MTYHHPVPLSRNLGNLTSVETSGPVQAWNGIVLTLPLPLPLLLNASKRFIGLELSKAGSKDGLLYIKSVSANIESGNGKT